MKKPLFQQLSSAICAYQNCIESNNTLWEEKHLERIHKIEKELPSGSGIDMGTLIALDESTSERIVFTTAYHHMRENGMYDGWTEHRIILTPSLQFQYSLRITGRDRNGIKDYLHVIFSEAIEQEIEF